MTKTEAMIGNLKLKECDSILEFLFNDGDVPENKQQNAARLKFKAGISHEIKNPLNCIISYAELLKKNSNLLQEELKRYVENICISSLQLKNLLVDVIENAKFEYEKITVKKQTFETGGEIKNVLRTFEEQIRSKNIMFSTALMQVNIISDVTKFNQILYNLVSNAVKYTNKNGSIDITSWVEDDKFYFEIKNSGSFINKKEPDRIFDFLRKADDDLSKNPENSGIGLCISRQIAEALGGKLEVESSRKKTIFRFYLPV